MNWYPGNIVEAVSLSKSKNAIFVVYIAGNDDLTKKLTNFINNEKIKTKLEGDEFVAIRIEGGSTAYMQFAQIYQLVPLPSLFFIGKNGTPLEVVTGIISSVDELNDKIENVLKLAGISSKENTDESVVTVTTNPSSSPEVTGAIPKNTISSKPSTSASADFISHEQKATVTDSTKNVDKVSDVICDGDVCYKKSETVETKEFDEKSETEEAEKPHTIKKAEDNNQIKTDIEEGINKENKNVEVNENEVKTPLSAPQKEENDTQKMQHAKKVLEEKRKQREQEEIKLEREREIARRKMGQEMQNMKKWQKDQDIQQLQEKIKKQKMEEQLARQRILEQIAGDRAERAQKMNIPSSSVGNQNIQKTKATTSGQKPKENGPESARIQFRKQTGESETHNFLPTDQFKVVRDFVKSTLLDGTKVKEFSLATTFPRREFTVDDDTKTLQELDLYPSAVLLVLIPTITSGPAAVVARSGGFINVFNTLFWTMLSPIFYIFNYVKGIFVGRPNNTNPGGSSSGGDVASGSSAQKRNNQESISNEVSKRRNIDRLQNREIIDDSSAASTSANATNSNKTKSLPYRRIGNSNVHRLRDQKDSDDENNTWNGNSTQQQ